MSDPDECIELHVKKHFDFLNIPHEELVESHVAMPLEYFWIDGPNGKHQVQVLEFLGPHLGELFKIYEPSRALVKDVCPQLVDAMDFLHSTMVCHGDFRPENIMMRLISDVDDWSEDRLLTVLGRPDLAHVSRQEEMGDDGSPCTRQVAVSDFGVGIDVQQPSAYTTGIPSVYATPESSFSLGGLGPASYIWSPTSTICVVATGHDLLVYQENSFLCGAELKTYIHGPNAEALPATLERKPVSRPRPLRH